MASNAPWWPPHGAAARMFERCQLHPAVSDSSCLYAPVDFESSRLPDLRDAPEPSWPGCVDSGQQSEFWIQPGARCFLPNQTSAELYLGESVGT
jgi:hypothetical protein